MTFIPPKVIITAKTAIAYIQNSKLNPDILLTAKAPRYKIEVKLTTTYKANQKTAIIIATVPL